VFGVHFSFKKFFLLCLLAFASSQTACSQPTDAMHLPLDPVPLVVMTEKGSVEIKVEIAKTPLERARGLMFREKLQDGQGMLFVFEDEDFRAFWMKDTPQPLDILYIAADGKLVSVQKGEPFSTDPIPSGEPAQFVLELARGEAGRLGLSSGALISHPIIAAASK
jgi:uncharacterized protein